MRRRYSIGYFISQALKGMWRNRVMTVTSVLVLMCCLVVMGIFALLLVNINYNLEDLSFADEIVVFLDYEATDDDVARVKEKIESLESLGIAEVTHVDKEQALKDMKDSYGDEYKDMFDVVAEDNPLAHSFVVKVDDFSRGVELQFALENLDGSVRKVSNRIDIAQQFETAKTNVTYAFGVFLIVLFAVCLFVILNTVSLAVYARRDEIIVMRYVGASRWFVATPFVLEGVFIGAIAAGVAYAVERKVYEYITSMITGELGFIRLVDMYEKANENALSLDNKLLIGFLAIGIMTGIVGSLLSLRKRIEA